MELSVGDFKLLTIRRLLTLTFVFLLSLDNSDNYFFSTLQLIHHRSRSSSLVSGLTPDTSSFSLKSNSVYQDGSMGKLRFSNEEPVTFGGDRLVLPDEKDLETEQDLEISRSVEPQVLQRLESQFLKLFGMKQRPTKQKRIKIPKYVVQLYKRQNGNDLPTSNLNLPGRHTRTANTVRTFYHHHQKAQAVKVGNSENHLFFDLSTVPVEEIVTGSELRIPFTVTLNGETSDKSDNLHHENKVNKVRVLLHDVMQPATKSNSKKPANLHLKEPITRPIDTKQIDLSKRKNGTSTFWLTFDVFPAVNRWMKSPKRNHGLLLEISGLNKKGVQVVQGEATHNLRVKRDTVESSSSKTASLSRSSLPEKGAEVGAAAVLQNDAAEITDIKVPTLFAYSDDGHSRQKRDAKSISRKNRNAKRRKRRRKHRNKNKRRNLCSRHEMFVDFGDVGWNNWIVAPPGYKAYYCGGECPFPMADHLNATNHAVIQALVHSMDPGRVPAPCCVPTKYTSVSLLYLDSSDKIVLKNYDDMIVDSCGCS